MTRHFLRLAKCAAICCTALLLLPGPAGADPRWWWDDVPVTADGAEKASLDLAFVGGEVGGQGTGFVFLVWQQRQDPTDDWEIWLAASPDGGCSFCSPLQITDNDVDDTRPRIAVAALSTGTMPLSFQIVFEQAGNIMLAYDAMTISSMTQANQLCARLPILGDSIILDQQYRQLNPVAGTARRPDIALSTLFFQFNHFHAVWEDSSAGEWDVVTDRDLNGDATGYGSPLVLTPHAVPAGDAVLPALTGDSLGEVSGLDGGVSVAFLEASTGEVLALRSSDSGGTWSPTGAAPTNPPVDPPVAVSQGSPSPLHLAIDDSDAEFGAGEVWTMAGWIRNDAAGAESDVQHHVDPLAPDVTWDAGGDRDLGPAPFVTSRNEIILESGFGEPAPAWAFWSDQVGPFLEIVGRAGLMDASLSPALDTATYPIPPTRPQDTTVSTVRQITHCRFDPTDFGCIATRPAGLAQDMAGADDSWAGGGGAANHLAWIDTRTGDTEVFYKRTDTFSAAAFPQITPSCATSIRAQAALEILPPAMCGSNFPYTEKILTYEIYYGTDPGGPYLNAASPIVIEDPDPNRPEKVMLTDLALGTTHYVIVVPEDEARNLQPADFDPTEDRADWIGEVSFDTPAACAPEVVVTACSLGPDRCSDPGHPVEGNYDFGESYPVRVTVENIGTLAANDVTGTLTVGNATANVPPGGTFGIPTLPVGATQDVLFNVLVDPSAAGATCGDPLDATLSSFFASNGGPWPDDPLDTCDAILGDGAGGCTECGAGPDVVVNRCDLLEDLCSEEIGSPGDGIPDPGERVMAELELLNVGSTDAVDYQADLELPWGGTAVSGIGRIGPVTIPAGASHVHAFEVDVADLCGDLVDVDLLNQRADRNNFSWPDRTVVCDRRIGADPFQLDNFYFGFTSVTIPDDRTEVMYPDVLSTPESLRVELAELLVTGDQPDPADINLRLVPPGGGPGIDVSPAWNSNLDITDIYNDPGSGGPGFWTLYVQDLVRDGGEGNVFTFQINVRDVIAECHECRACIPQSAPGPIAAFAEDECALRVNWNPGEGEAPLAFDLYRDGAMIASGITDTTYLDTNLVFGDPYVYRVEASDSCPSGTTLSSGNSAPGIPGDRVPPTFGGPPSATYDGSIPENCEVMVNIDYSSRCTPIGRYEILRDGVYVKSTGVDPFPWTDLAPGNGNYTYEVHLTDVVGNLGTSPPSAPVVVDNCVLPDICLYVMEVADLAAFNQDKPTGYFHMPREVGEQPLDTAPFTCPFASGDRLALNPGNAPLTFYAIDRNARDFAVRRDGFNEELEITFTP